MGLASAWVLAAAVWPAAVSAAENAASLERRVKAAYLYKFSGYVEWPAASLPRPESPIIIGVAGDNRLASDLAQMTLGRNTGGHPIRVVQLDADDRPKKLHMLYVTGTETERIKAWTDLVHGSPVLIVADSPGALEKGAMINFAPSDGRIRFDVALAPALACGLRLSSGLLAVAKTVLPAPQ